MDLESIDQVLKTARSVRRNLDYDRELPFSVIKECIDVATQAPVALGGESWRFIVVTEPQIKVQLARIYEEVLIGITSQRGVDLKSTHRALLDRLHEIPVMVFVCAIGVPGIGISQQVAFYGSVLPAAWSLMLAMRARDIGTTWTTLLSSRQTQVAALLGIPAGVSQVVMFPAAYTKNAVMKVADRLPASEVTYLNRWDNLRGVSE